MPHLALMMGDDPHRTLQQQRQTEGSRAQQVEVVLTQEILTALRICSCEGSAQLHGERSSQCICKAL